MSDINLDRIYKLSRRINNVSLVSAPLIFRPSVSQYQENKVDKTNNKNPHAEFKKNKLTLIYSHTQLHNQ